MRRVSFKTFGCRLNQYESEWLREEFELAGFESIHLHGTVPRTPGDNEQRIVESGPCTCPDPDIFVVNTCAVTGKACREARNAIRAWARKHQKSFIIITGCYAKISPDEISKLKGVNIIEPDPKRIVTDFLKVPLLPGIKSFNGRNKAFVKVQEGCDQFCSYCVVPYAKGKPRERALKEIFQEVDDLIQNGYQEFILTGTNLGKCQNLLQITRSIEGLEGVKRIGLGSIEPVGISDELLEFIGGSSKCAKYLHIPLQSGNDRILKLMGRWYTRKEYEELLYRVKEKVPEVAIGTDVIVGFPGEGEKEFLNTYELIANSPISRLHVFKYSKRPGTRALALKDEPSEDIKKERSKAIRKLGEEKWSKFRAQFIGKILEAHIEGIVNRESLIVNRDANRWIVGVSPNYIKVLFKLHGTRTDSTSRGSKVLKDEGVSPLLLKGGTHKGRCGGEMVNPHNNNFVKLQIKKIEGPLTYGELV